MRTVGVTTQMTHLPMRWRVKGAHWLSDTGPNLWRRFWSTALTNGRLNLKRSSLQMLNSPAFRSSGKVVENNSFLCIFFFFLNRQIPVIKHQVISFGMDVWCWLTCTFFFSSLFYFFCITHFLLFSCVCSLFIIYTSYTFFNIHSSCIHSHTKNPTCWLFPSVYSLCIAVVAGPSSSSSVPDDITDDVTLSSDQSSKPTGKDSEQGKQVKTVIV